MTNWKSVRIGCAVAALALMVTASGHAFANHENRLTFNRPVALPGVVLPAGAYSFDLVDATSRDIVIVRNSLGTKVYYMGFTNLVERPRGMSLNTPVTFAEAPANAPRPIATWYELGGSIGHEFLYR